MKKIMLTLLAGSLICCSKAQTGNADTNYTTRISSVKWMPDGKAILLGIIKHHKTNEEAPFFSKVVLYDIKNSQLEFLFADGSNLAPSPDGKNIAFLKRSETKRSAIYFFNVKTKKETVLKTDSSEKYGLSWSPDGKNLVYNILNREPGKPVDIFVLDLLTKQVKQVTQSGKHKSYDPAWSPDSKRIAYYFEKDDHRDQIWLTDINGSFHTNLTNDTSTHNFYPSWTDDTTIIYTQSPSFLMMMNVEGSHRKKIEGINATPVAYNANAGKLAYIKSETENILMLYDWKTGTATEVLDGNKLLNLFES